MAWNERFDAIVVGSGFGSAVAITKLVTQGLPNNAKPRVLVLERGTWWQNPEGPGLNSFKQKPPAPILGKWQYWPRPNDSRGLTYLASSIYKEHNPIADVLNPMMKDTDLGPSKNLKGLYRLSRFSHKNGSVDVVSASAVGGGSLIYSGVNLIPHKPVLDRVGLGYLTSSDFKAAGAWMKQFRGSISKINTKIPVPQYRPQAIDPGKHFQLNHIPESQEQPSNIDFEMPNPDLTTANDADYILLDRARVLKRAMERAIAAGGFTDNGAVGVVLNEPNHDPFEPLPLSVVEYDPGANSQSTKTNTFCLREGRCMLGCLPSARHTLYKTIQDRQEQGDDITVLPLTKVSHISREGQGYVVHFKSYLEEAEGRETRAVASKVFLGAGCLGTTEILLRTQQRFDKSGGTEGLPLSPMVGKHFSTNGDFFAFTYGLASDRDTRRTITDDKRIGNANPTVGPINSSHFYVAFDQQATDRVDVNVEDAGIPTTFARLVHGLLPEFSNFEKFKKLAGALIAILFGREPFGESEKPDTTERTQTAYLTDRELISDVFFFNLMGAGPNEPFGTFALQKDGEGLDLSFSDSNKLGEWVVFKRQETVLKTLTAQMAETGFPAPKLMLSPFWGADRRVTVVHPLGGAPMGPDSSRGAVDLLGRIYDGSQQSSTAVHRGLYVVDASAIPGAVGVNPTFTIVTLAVRAVNNAVGES